MELIHDQQLVSKCQDSVLNILKLWSKSAADAEAAYKRLKSYVTSNFDRRELVVSNFQFKRWVKFAKVGKRIEVVFSDDPNPLNDITYEKATFYIGLSRDSWRLESLTFLCPACFGDGLMDGEVCTLCDGVGWGAGVDASSCWRLEP